MNPHNFWFLNAISLYKELKLREISDSRTDGVKVHAHMKRLIVPDCKEVLANSLRYAERT